MSPSLNSGTITVIPPPVTPPIIVQSPVTPPIIVAPIQGPPGPIGPPGDSIEVSFQHTQSTPATLVQIIHNLSFPPAGILCQDTGIPALTVEYATVSYPLTGVIELMFGFPFTGTVYLS
jgi:hypothetical protein